MTSQAQTESVELDLIVADACVAVRGSLSPRAHRDAPVLALISFPAAGFVAEETHNYFSARNRALRLGPLDGELFTRFGHALKKVRARIKLLDDSDQGPESLVEFMELVRASSPVLFSHASSRMLQLISRPFRPDLGAYFVSDQLVATSHAVLPTLGFTPEILRAAKPGEFSCLKRFVREFAENMGAFFAHLRSVLAAHGRALELDPEPIAPEVKITFNDFKGDRLYRHAQKHLDTVLPERVPVLTVCLVQANAALHVLPELLGQSNLLRRMQYLTAYHGTTTLRRALRVLPPWLEPRAGDPLDARPLRNLLAHYELRAAAPFAVGSEDPLGAAMTGVCGVAAENVVAAARERLERISDFLGAPLGKRALRGVRALLGDHT